jgi:glutamyl-tRNA reductase
VRTDTGIARGTTSFSHAAVAVARQQLTGRIEESNVVVVGAGEMGSGVCRAIAGLADPPQQVVVLNRSQRRAEALLHDASAPPSWRAAALENAHAELARADLVLCAVAADGHVLAPAHFAGVAGPLLVIDLGVPRNIDPAVASLPAVTLLDMDTLSETVAQAIGVRQEEAIEAQRIIEEEVDRYRTASRERGAAPVIAALRARLESLRETELERHRAQLADLSQAEWEQVDQATRAAMAKLLHEPTMVLKETAGTPRGERLVEALRILFDL